MDKSNQNLNAKGNNSTVADEAASFQSSFLNKNDQNYPYTENINFELNGETTLPNDYFEKTGYIYDSVAPVEFYRDEIVDNYNENIGNYDDDFINPEQITHFSPQLLKNINDNFSFLKPKNLESAFNNGYFNNIFENTKNKNYETFDEILKDIRSILNKRTLHINELLRKVTNDFQYNFLNEELNRIDFELNSLIKCKTGVFNLITKSREKVNAIFADAKVVYSDFSEILNHQLAINEASSSKHEKNKNEIISSLKKINSEISDIDVDLINKQIQLDESLLNFNGEFEFNDQRINNEIQGLQIEYENLVNKRNVLNYKLEEFKKDLFENLHLINEKKQVLNSILENFNDKISFYYDSLAECINEISEQRNLLVDENENSEYLELLDAYYEYIDTRSIEVDNILQSINDNLSYAIDNVNPLYGYYFVEKNSFSNISIEKHCLDLQFKALCLLKNECITEINDLINDSQQKLKYIQDLISKSAKNEWIKDFLSNAEKNSLNLKEFSNLTNNKFDTKNFLKFKQKEIDELFLFFNSNLKDNLSFLKKDQSLILKKLQTIKSKINDQFKNLDENNFVSLVELFDIQFNIASILVDLESLNLNTLDSENLKQKLISLDQFFKDTVLDIETNLDNKINEINNKFSFLQMTLNQNASNAFDLKNKINDAYYKIQTNPNNIEVKKIKSNLTKYKKELVNIDNKNEKLFNQLNSMSNVIFDLNKHIDIDISEVNKLDLIKSENILNDLLTKNDLSKNKFISLFLIVHEIVSYEKLINDKLSNFNQVKPNKHENTLHDLFVKKMQDQLQLIKLHLDNITTIKNTFKVKLNKFKNVSNNFSEKINNLVNNKDQTILNENRQNYKLIEETNNLIDQMQESKQVFFNKMNTSYKNINDRHDLLNAKTDDLLKQFYSIKNSKNVDNFNDEVLKKIKKEQEFLISEKQKLLNERDSLNEKLKKYELNIREEDKKNKDLYVDKFNFAKQKNKDIYDSKMDEIKSILNQLLDNISNFKEFEKKQIKDLQNKYTELQNSNVQNDVERKNLQKDFEKFLLKINEKNKNNSSDNFTNIDQNASNLKNFHERQEKLEISDEKLELRCNALLNDLNQMINQIGFNFDDNDYDTYLKQKQRDGEIRDILQRIEKHYSDLTFEKKEFINNIQNKYIDLNNQQKKINLETEFLKKEIENIQQNNFKNNLKNIDKKLVLLQEKCQKLHYSNLKLNSERAELLSKLREFQLSLINDNCSNQIQEYGTLLKNFFDNYPKPNKQKFYELQNEYNDLVYYSQQNGLMNEPLFTQIVNDYNSLCNFENETSSLRSWLERDFINFNLAKNSLNLDKSFNLNKEGEKIFKFQKKLLNDEQLLIQKQEKLLFEIRKMKQYFSENTKNKDHLNFKGEKAYKNLTMKNEEINDILNKLELKKFYFDKYTNHKVDRLRNNQIDLNNRQKELEIQSKKLSDDVKKLTELKRDASISDTNYNNELFLLKANQETLNLRSKEIEKTRLDILNNAKKIQDDLERKEKLLEMSKLHLHKVNLEQENRTKELKKALHDLNAQRNEFDIHHHRELEKINLQHRKIEERELELKQKFDQLEKETEKLNKLKYDTLISEGNYSYQLELLKANQTNLDNHLKELQKTREKLLHDAKKMQGELARKEKMLEINKLHLHKVNLEQENKVKELEIALKNLNEKRNEFDIHHHRELEKINLQHRKIEERELELKQKFDQLEKETEKLNELRQKTLITEEKYAYQLNLLKTNQKNLDNRSLELEKTRQELLHNAKKLEEQLLEKEQILKKEKLRLYKINLKQDNKSKELEKALNDLNKKRNEFDVNCNQELEKINLQHRKIEERELELKQKFDQLEKETKKLSNKRNNITNDELKLRNQYEQHLILKEAIIKEQKELELYKNNTIQNLKKINEELLQKKSKLKSLYNKVHKTNYEQKLKQEEFNAFVKDHNVKVEDFNKIKNEFEEKKEIFEKEQKNKIEYLNKIYKNLLKHQIKLKNFQNKLFENKNALDAESKKLEVEKNEIQKTKDQQNEITKIKCDKSNQIGENRMCNLECNNCSCSKHEQNSLILQNQKPLCNGYNLLNSPFAVDPLIQMQQLVQRQQIQMLKQEHKYEMQEANRQRQALERKLHDLIELQQDQLKQSSTKVNREQEESLNRMMRSLIQNTQIKFKELEKMLSTLKEEKNQINEVEKKIASELNNNTQINNQLANVEFLNGIKNEILNEVNQFKKYQTSLVEKLYKKEQEQFNKFYAKEKQLKDMIVEMHKNFSDQLNILRTDKQSLNDQLLEYKKIINESSTNSKSDSLDEAKIILEETKNLLTKERERYAREREQIIRDGYLNDILKKNEAKNIQTQKQMQIQKLTDEIKKIKDLLEN